MRQLKPATHSRADRVLSASAPNGKNGSVKSLSIRTFQVFGALLCEIYFKCKRDFQSSFRPCGHFRESKHVRHRCRVSVATADQADQYSPQPKSDLSLDRMLIETPFQLTNKAQSESKRREFYFVQLRRRL